MAQPPVKLAPPLPVDAMKLADMKSFLQRAQTTACTLPERHKPSCGGAVYLGLFFDGTGNNRDADLPEQKHSNVVRMWMAHRDSAQDGASQGAYHRREYVPGVGTPFPGIGETESRSFAELFLKLGKAMALGGQGRIYWGLLQAINVMHRYVQKTALIDDHQAGDMARRWSRNADVTLVRKTQIVPLVDKLKAALQGAKPHVSSLNLSVFGFSRGSAQARAFCNSFFSLCEGSGTARTFAGVPVRILFLGIFDTVASVGAVGGDVLNLEGHQGWAADGALRVHPDINRCVHFVASHEVRACFGLDSARYQGSYPPNVEEFVYPGTHSDVGGGYRPRAQGRSPLAGRADGESFLAVAPAVHMYREAMLAGVPLKAFDQMRSNEQRNFMPTPEARDAFNAYVAAEAHDGSVEEVLARRMDRYRLYRFRKLGTFVEEAVAQGASKEEARFLGLVNEHFAERCHDAQRRYANAKRISDHERQLAWARHVAGKPQPLGPPMTLQTELQRTFVKEDLDMWNAMHRSGDIPPALEALFDCYVHDSMAGFAQNGVDEYAYNHRGLMRNRDIYDKGGA